MTNEMDPNNGQVSDELMATSFFRIIVAHYRGFEDLYSGLNVSYDFDESCHTFGNGLENKQVGNSWIRKRWRITWNFSSIREAAVSDI